MKKTFNLRCKQWPQNIIFSLKRLIGSLQWALKTRRFLPTYLHVSLSSFFQTKIQWRTLTCARSAWITLWTAWCWSVVTCVHAHSAANRWRSALCVGSTSSGLSRRSNHKKEKKTFSLLDDGDANVMRWYIFECLWWIIFFQRNNLFWQHETYITNAVKKKEL